MHLGSWLCYRALHLATVGENCFWMQLSWRCVKAQQSGSAASAGVTVSGGLNQCSEYRATDLQQRGYRSAQAWPGERSASWSTAALGGGWSQLSRNEVAPSVHGNS